MNKEKAKKEQEIKAKMSEKAYLQRQLSRKIDFMGTIVFSTKFMLIAMTIAFAVFILFLVISYSTFMLISTIICGAIFIASWVWLFVWLLHTKPKFKAEIREIEQKLMSFNQETSDKYQKIAQKLKEQREERENNQQ